MAPATAGAAGKAPLDRELRKCGQLRYLAKQKDKTVGRNICNRGVRFKWRSKDNKRAHWGTRPATAREVSALIRQLRALLRPAPSSSGGWAIPVRVVMCESGGRNMPPNATNDSGYYQFNQRTWRAVGGSTPHAYQAPKAEQDRLAAKLWAGGAGASHWNASRHCWG